MSDVNLIPKKEAIAYLKSNIPKTPEDLTLTKSLIELLELDLIEASYQNGKIAYRAKGDPFNAFIKTMSTVEKSEFELEFPKFLKYLKDIEEYPESDLEIALTSLQRLLEEIEKLNQSELKRLIPHIQKTIEKFNSLGIKPLTPMLKTFSEQIEYLTESDIKKLLPSIREIYLNIDKLAIFENLPKSELIIIKNKLQKILEKYNFLNNSKIIG